MDELLERRKVLLGVSGSIASYKAAEFARLLVSRGYDVRVAMSDAAQKFIRPLTFEAITGKKVYSDLWEESREEGVEHVSLADWADVIVIAPGTADLIAKIASGFADEPLLALILASKAPIVLAPAMNVNMWNNKATIENIAKLKARGVIMVGPDEGDLACGWTGAGRLSDSRDIFYAVRRALSNHDYRNKKVLITTGPTREPIDPVRFISNRSSGKMGIALAREVFRRGGEVTLIHGPMNRYVGYGIEAVPVNTAKEMADATLDYLFENGREFDCVIMVAAVADFKPKEPLDRKLKRREMPGSIEIEPNLDILGTIGAKRNELPLPCVVAGFAVETGELDDLLQELESKLQSKNADLIIGNLAQEAFDLDTNRVWLVDRQGRREEVATNYKSRIANKILDKILKLA